VKLKDRVTFVSFFTRSHGIKSLKIPKG